MMKLLYQLMRPTVTSPYLLANLKYSYGLYVVCLQPNLHKQFFFCIKNNILNIICFIPYSMKSLIY